MDINDLQNIIGILKENQVSEFELEHDGTRIKLTRSVDGFHAQGVAPLVERVSEDRPLAGQAEAGAKGAESAPAEEADYVRVDSPIVGTFYRRPSPDADPFVREGDLVKSGQTLCIIEAMKIMNEIESPCDGRIVKVQLSDSQMVEFGESLFLIDPQA